MQLFKSPVRMASLVLVLVGAGLLGLIILGRGTLNVALPLVFLMLGGAFFILALAARSWRWASLGFIPGALLMALGLVLLLNVLTQDWNAWAYAWLIVVAGVGAGMVLASQGQAWPGVVSLVGWCLVGGGVTLAVVFGAIAGGLFIQVMAPILLILGGLSLRWLPWEKILPERMLRRLQRTREKDALTANYTNYANSHNNKAEAQAAPQAAGVLVQRETPEDLVEALSPRELEVLRLVDQGLTNQQIAEHLSVAPSTVKTHINNIYGKMAVESRLQAVKRGKELGLI